MHHIAGQKTAAGSGSEPTSPRGSRSGSKLSIRGQQADDEPDDASPRQTPKVFLPLPDNTAIGSNPEEQVNAEVEEKVQDKGSGKRRKRASKISRYTGVANSMPP